MNYTQIQKSYEPFSLESAIQGGYRQCIATDECWCMSAKNVQLPKNGTCYPECLCQDCRLDQSGLCRQDAGDSSIPGV